LQRAFVALDAVAGIGVNAEHTRRVAAGVDVDVGGGGVGEGVLATVTADRARRVNGRLAHSGLHQMFVADGLAVGGFALLGLRNIDTPTGVPIPLLGIGAADGIAERLKKNRAVVLMAVVSRVIDLADVADVGICRLARFKRRWLGYAA